MLEDYNAIQESYADMISSAEAYEHSLLRSRLISCGMQATGADLPERQQVIQAYLTLQQSSEEIELLKEDIKNVLYRYTVSYPI